MGRSGATRRRGPSDSATSRDCKPNLDAGGVGHYIGRIMDGPSRKPGASKPDKDGRLAKALRENLRKRKDQARSRSHTGRASAGIPGNRPENDTDSSEKS